MKFCKLYVWLVIGFLSVVIAGCDPEEQIPAYLTIDSISVKNLNYASQGTANHNIKDAWVYIDNQLLGVFELPARFPVLAEGSHSVLIGAGILENGISATRVRYPLYTSYEVAAFFKAGETITLPDPVELNYFPTLSYSWYEDFEGNTFSFDSVSGSQAGFIPFNSDMPFEGNFSGKFKLTEAASYFEGSCTSELIDINGFSSAWVELNYKAEQPFSVGLKVKLPNGTVTSNYVSTVNRSDKWNKIYINVSDVVGRNQSAVNFKVYIAANLEQGRTESVIYVDNIKLIHN